MLLWHNKKLNLKLYQGYRISISRIIIDINLGHFWLIYHQSERHIGIHHYVGMSAIHMCVHMHHARILSIRVKCIKYKLLLVYTLD